MTPKLRFAAIVAAVFPLAAAGTYASVSLLDGGGASAPPGGRARISWTVEDAKAFDEFPLYWLGESYEGLPLTDIIRYKFDPPPEMLGAYSEDIVLFIYG